MRVALRTVAAVLAGLVPTAAEAASINGGFEDGFAGWEAVGDYRVETSTFGSEPVEGNSQAFLSTAFNEVLIPNQPPEGNAVPSTFITGSSNNLEGFLGLSTFLGDKSLDSIATAQPIEGSAIKQSFTASSGDVVSFSWNFVTNESVEQAARNDFTFPNFNDFAFATIQSDSSKEIFSLADTISSFSNSSTPLFNETGNRTFSYTIPNTGSYTLGIGVVDVGEPTRISGLLVDNVEAIPEPSSTLGALGVLFLGACWKVSALKRSQKKK
jgi:hypothetical protein